ncbi:uncharacterized protein FYW61_021251 [Anableps anableps]
MPGWEDDSRDSEEQPLLSINLGRVKGHLQLHGVPHPPERRIIPETRTSQTSRQLQPEVRGQSGKRHLRLCRPQLAGQRSKVRTLSQSGCLEELKDSSVSPSVQQPGLGLNRVIRTKVQTQQQICDRTAGQESRLGNGLAKVQTCNAVVGPSER